ncbi:asparagine synthase (glutamine-hydrolyzing) [Gracilibacillus alcaliphilus]|uniref:asparagine synthase (glutamine-hydrolyzing) n=1 Tax=Gracilibacillus alcaliphilus TaxID=1401441 RepID=UPI00195B7A85|nr:asparagine synthase (glutamine-hydrolyzing) [Gracilibacillus alcaliphilus]MBM7675438.1 asparagine synthase (glutamine-hydrolyzing) [Gracilibacillus alcaliphilus]
MCGITGWVDFSRDVELQQVQVMTEQLKHRGPDENGYFNDTHLAFGHQRLIVVDPDGGKQPMQSQRHGLDYVLVYNGELYNTEELRNALIKKGWTFNSHSDTEVLLKSYMEWGEDHVDKLNGIFAYAIWDPKHQQLFLARDRLGVKPLFYTEHRNGILFASEIKALLAHTEIKAVLKEEGLSEVLALGPSRTPGHGVFDGLHELRAAHVGIYNRDGWKTRRYWNVRSQLHQDSVEETALRVRQLLMEAVERQLVSDVPLGTFLSGGVDSSAITAIAANKLDQPFQTFSIDYQENDKYFTKSSFQPNQDRDFIKTMVEALGTDHHTCTMENKMLADLLKAAVTYRDLPGMADVDSSFLWFCQQTKQHVTVALSGECADEIFGGYPWFYRADDLNRQGFPWIRSSEVRKQLLRDQITSKLDIDQYLQERYHETIQETPLLEGENSESAARRQMFYLNMHWFMPTLLDRKDRMSMGASFEARVPFSDHHLVEYVWNIPWEMKNYGNREKGILRKALEGLLPDEILYRKKSPYPKTYHPDYTAAVVQWMESIVDNKQSRLFEIMDRDKVAELVRHRAANIRDPWFGQLMAGPQLLAHIAQINYWLEAYDVTIDL